MKKYFLLIALILSCKMAFGQGIEKNFIGMWAETIWEFRFSENGKFERISSGHFGNTSAKGKYKIVNDTIKIISGDEESAGTINEKYIISKDDILIDLRLGYGYRKFLDSDRDKIMEFRTILYPEIEPVNKEVVSDMQEVLNLAFNSNKVKCFYHFDIQTTREFIIANYHKLKVDIEVDGRKAVFKDKKDIKEKFYIEFESLIRFYDRISLTIKIPEEGVQINCYYGKESGKWKEDFITVVEN
ncbi:hypothetical protein C3L50_08950 [Flavobacterium alvei]|uniref:DUF3108 domain-containing protein n=1 Tax=Flavobacterium alvei TaxID=2080416 RepID=A0A2S5ACI1_9FLAO|nr:hypothetical protein [Flavobacterium alvei]POY39947.1 hypothetical protein C3L50_08950 [Flavobacterium alvei]